MSEHHTAADEVRRIWRERSGVSRVRTLGSVAADTVGAVCVSAVLGPVACGLEVAR